MSSLDHLVPGYQGIGTLSFCGALSRGFLSYCEKEEFTHSLIRLEYRINWYPLILWSDDESSTSILGTDALVE